MRSAIVGSVALLLAVGCGGTSMPVRLQGDPVSIAWLAGSWTGEYWGGTGRGGSLSFTLRSGSDSLYGDVTMMDLAGQPMRSADPEHVRTRVNSPRQLRIDFVAIQADSIRGTLEPYVLPECECVVSTTFVGQVRGSQITGSFETRQAGRLRAEGSWEMKRVADASR